MITHLLRGLILASLICTCVAPPARATPVTYYFDGSIYSGSLSFDPGTGNISNVVFLVTGYPETWVQVDPNTFVDPPYIVTPLQGADVVLYSPSLQFPGAPGGDLAGFILTDSTFSNSAPLDGIHNGYADVFADLAGYYGPVSEFLDPNACTDNPNPNLCNVQHSNNFTSCAATPTPLCLEDPNTPFEIVVDSFEAEVLTLSPPATAVPEPSSLVLLCGGIFAAGLVRLTSLLRRRTNVVAGHAIGRF